ncbi:MAG: helix-turn-helix domain-containing protein [Nitrospira sp.]|nr:helix-turn-helix domain-containing protein [Nitrospira sp.]
MIQSERQAYSRSEAASTLGCSEATIDRMIRGGQLRGTRIGKRRIVITGTEIQRLLSEGVNASKERRDHQK